MLYELTGIQKKISIILVGWSKGRLEKEVGLYLGPERTTKSKAVERKTRCILLTLNFQQSGYTFQGLYESVREKLVKVGWSQITENDECKIREWGLYSVSDRSHPCRKRRDAETKMHVAGWRNDAYLNFPLVGHLQLLIFLQ